MHVVGVFVALIPILIGIAIWNMECLRLNELLCNQQVFVKDDIMTKTGFSV